MKKVDLQIFLIVVYLSMMDAISTKIAKLIGFSASFFDKIEMETQNRTSSKRSVRDYTTVFGSKSHSPQSPGMLTKSVD